MRVDPYAVSLPSMIVWQLIVATVHSFSPEWTTGTAETVQFHKAFYWCLEAVWISVWIYQETWNLLGMLWKSKVIACYSFHLQAEKCFSNLSLRWFPRNDQVFKNTPSSVHHWRDIPRLLRYEWTLHKARDRWGEPTHISSILKLPNKSNQVLFSKHGSSSHFSHLVFEFEIAPYVSISVQV